MSVLIAKVVERLEWLEGLMRDDPGMGQWHLHLDYDPSGTCRCSIEVLNKSGKRSIYSSEPFFIGVNEREDHGDR